MESRDAVILVINTARQYCMREITGEVTLKLYNAYMDPDDHKWWSN